MPAPLESSPTIPRILPICVYDQDATLFTGYFRDSETGLDYAKARYHQPGMGRFLTADPYMASGGPADPGSWNRYAYVGGDPISFVDPTGEYMCNPANPECQQAANFGFCDPYDPDCGNTCGPGQFFNPGVGYCTTKPGPTYYSGPFGPAGSGPPPAPSGAKYAGFNDAINDLGKSKCADLIAGASGLTADQLQSSLKNADVTTNTINGNTPYTDSGRGGISVQNAYTTGGNIYLNGNYFPDNTTTAGILPYGLTLLSDVNEWLGRGSDLTSTQLGTLVFLHELAHIAAGGTAGGATIDSKTFNRSIVSLCIN